MNNLMKNKFRILALLILVLVLGAATYGFAAANVVPDGRAGEGEGAITGYQVVNVKYTLNVGNPLLFSRVQFDLVDPITGNPAAASDVYAGTGDSVPTVTWVSCGAGSGGYDYDCLITSAVTSSISLHVSSVE